MTAPAPRICHLADIHLGYRRYNRLARGGFNQREVDVSAAFREAIDRVIDLKPAATLIAGDLFHSVRPSNAVLAFAFREIRRLVRRSGAPVVILAGNHESPKRIDTGSALRLLGEIEGCHVADGRAERFSFPERDLSVLCLPHGALSRLGDTEVRADDAFRYNVLALHGQLSGGWVSEFGGEPFELGRLSPHEWNYIALGHVHVFRTVALNAAYSGAIEHTTVNLWSEAHEGKGFLEVDLGSGQPRFHRLTTPREVAVMPPIDALELEPHEIMERIRGAVAEVPGGIEGKLVRLEISNISRPVFRQLDHRELRRLRSLALNLTLDVHTVEGAGVPVEVPAPGRLVRRAPLAEDLHRFCVERLSGHLEGVAIGEVLGSYLKKLEEEDEAPQA